VIERSRSIGLNAKRAGVLWLHRLTAQLDAQRLWPSARLLKLGTHSIHLLKACCVASTHQTPAAALDEPYHHHHDTLHLAATHAIWV
jgi:hypothetical protein